MDASAFLPLGESSDGWSFPATARLTYVIPAEISGTPETEKTTPRAFSPIIAISNYLRRCAQRKRRSASSGHGIPSEYMQRQEYVDIEAEIRALKLRIDAFEAIVRSDDADSDDYSHAHLRTGRRTRVKGSQITS